MIEPSDIEMIDCAWLACDTFGRLAVLITAGCGPVPAAVFEAPVDIVDVERRLHDLPSSGTARLTASYGDMSSFSALAERGLFAFDWSDIHKVGADETKAYELVAMPSAPRHLAASPTISVAPPNGSGWTWTLPERSG
jgi:hypothetical protein